MFWNGIIIQKLIYVIDCVSKIILDDLSLADFLNPQISISVLTTNILNRLGYSVNVKSFLDGTGDWLFTRVQW